MPKFSVDVKAFIRIEIEAEGEAQARSEAERFAEAQYTNGYFVDGWNQVQRETGQPIILEAGSLNIDGESDVEELEEERGICSVCWDQRCDGCTPPDTPSLDTSFHDHERA